MSKHIYKYIFYTTGGIVLLGAIFLSLCFKANGIYRHGSPTMKKRAAFHGSIHLAAPSLPTAGRNIAFENSNAITNAPASYLTMLDCCESDEAIADRMAVANTTSRLIRKRDQN
jgi:hypothetical protein